MNKERRGTLECYVKGEPDARTKVVVLHGYGADFHDLIVLGDMFPQAASVQWIFVNGPLRIPIGPQLQGRAWFDIDLLGMQQAIEEGNDAYLSGHRPAGMGASKKALQALLKESQIAANELILVGFSQGAMMALDVALTFKDQIKGLVLFSSTLVDLAGLKQKLPRWSGFEYLQSHGLSDPLLSATQAQALRKALDDSGWKGNFIEFRGQHEIPPEVLRAYQEYMKARFV